MGAAAEAAAAAYLQSLGWTILARNIRVGQDELDIIALDPRPRETVVVVEVRSRSGRRYGQAVESVDARKVARLYRATMRLRRAGHGALDIDRLGAPRWRVDLVTLGRTSGGAWSVESHLCGLVPP